MWRARRRVVDLPMDRAKCPNCGYLVGLGTASEPGVCPSCDLPLMLTCEFRALSREECLEQARARAHGEQTAATR